MKKIIIILIVLLFPMTSWADIGFDVANPQTYNAESTGTSQTEAFTVTGNNTYLIVNVVGGEAGDGDNISGCSYDGNTMVQIGKISTPSNNRYHYLFGIANGTGSGVSENIVCTKTNNTYSEIYASSYTGVNQSDNPFNSTTNVVTATSITTTLNTTGAPNAWLVGGVYCQNPPKEAGAGTVERHTDDVQVACMGIFDSNSALSEGSNSLIVSGNSSNKMGFIMATLANATASTAETNSSQIMIIGI